MGFKTVYIPKKHKELEDKLDDMGKDASNFILECIIKQIGVI